MTTKKINSTFEIYVIFMTLLSMMDVATTYVGLNNGLNEVNFLSLILLNKFGFFGIIILHFITLLLLIWFGKILKYTMIRHNDDKTYMFNVVIIIRFLVVVNNLFLIWRFSK